MVMRGGGVEKAGEAVGFWGTGARVRVAAGAGVRRGRGIGCVARGADWPKPPARGIGEPSQ